MPRMKMGPEENKELNHFVAAVGGVPQATRLQTIWRTSEKTPEYEQVTNRVTKFQAFRRLAVMEGFTKAQIDLFMNILT